MTDSNDIELLRLRTVLDSAGDGFILHDLKGNIIDVNQTLCDGLGFSREELLTLKIFDIDADAKCELDGMWDRLYKKDVNLITYGRHICKDGLLRPVELKLNAIEENGIPYISAFARDISQRKSTEDQLNFTQFAIDNAADAAFWFEACDYKFIYVNRKACEYLGYSKHKLLSMGVPDINPKFSSKDWQIFIQDLKIAGELVFESEHLRNDGTYVPVEVTASHMKFESRDYIITFVRDISNRRKAKQEIIKAKEKAENANKAKSDFLTSMSHELKTPLNAIIGYSEMLAIDSSPELSEEQLHFAKSVNQAGHHLLSLIEDVLDLATIEAGGANLKLGPVNLFSLVESCINLTKPIAAKKDISQISQEAITSDIKVYADEKKLKQIVLNLISNAIKYNNQKGSVCIKYVLTDKQIEVCIADTGPGIPEGRMSELFIAFGRLGQEDSDIEGTGVGLVICKQLVEIMSGQMYCESQLGKGSQFYFTIPLYVDAKKKPIS